VLHDIPISDITPNPNQPRVHFDEESLAELTASVQQIGVLQPILVRPVGTGYELIAGERRWRAAGRAGLATIPAVVRTTDDLASVEQALVENLHRQDLTPLEEAAAYQQLIEDFELTHEQVADRVGKSRSAITNTLRLLGLPPGIQRLLADGRLSAGHARALLGTPDRTLQEELARQAADEGLDGSGGRRGGPCRWRASGARAIRRRTAALVAGWRRRGVDAVHPLAASRAARTRRAPLRTPRHPRERADGGQEGSDRDRLRRSGGPGTHLPPDVGRLNRAPRWVVGPIVGESGPASLDLDLCMSLTSRVSFTHRVGRRLWITLRSTGRTRHSGGRVGDNTGSRAHDSRACTKTSTRPAAWSSVGWTAPTVTSTAGIRVSRRTGNRMPWIRGGSMPGTDAHAAATRSARARPPADSNCGTR
jgi:ParB/RepB/Spo0J family partition protein